MTVFRLSAEDLSRHIDALCEVLIDTVANGAAIGFLHPVEGRIARHFWEEEVRPGVEMGHRTLLGALDDGRLVGTVQVITSLPQNQPHRAEIAKMIVHPKARRRGLGRQLITAGLDHAKEVGKTLVTLDTRTGDLAQGLYASVGFENAGVIPDFGVDPDQKRLHATTYMYKRL